MTEVKDRPIDKLTRSSPDFWKREWHKRECKGCDETFMPEARSQLYCRVCSEAGKGWAGRKDKQAKAASQTPADGRNRYPYGENVVVEKLKNGGRRFKPFGDCTPDDLLAIAEWRYVSVRGTFGEARRNALCEAEKCAALAQAMKSRGVATISDLEISVLTGVVRGVRGLGKVEERKAAA